MIPHYHLSLQDPPIWLANEDEEILKVHIKLLNSILLLDYAWSFFSFGNVYIFHVSDAGMAVLVLFMHHLFHLLSSLASTCLIKQCLPILAA